MRLRLDVRLNRLRKTIAQDLEYLEVAFVEFFGYAEVHDYEKAGAAGKRC